MTPIGVAVLIPIFPKRHITKKQLMRKLDLVQISNFDGVLLPLCIFPAQ